MWERRASKRMGINTKIKLKGICHPQGPSNREGQFEVDVLNISRHGLAFKSGEKLGLNTYYDAKLVLWAKERVDCVIEVVRKENSENEPALYGCRFIGLFSSDQLKITIHELIMENRQ